MSSNHLSSVFDINNSSLKLYYIIYISKQLLFLSELCIVFLYIKSQRKKIVILLFFFYCEYFY